MYYLLKNIYTLTCSDSRYKIESEIIFAFLVFRLYYIYLLLLLFFLYSQSYYYNILFLWLFFIWLWKLYDCCVMCVMKLFYCEYCFCFYNVSYFFFIYSTLVITFFTLFCNLLCLFILRCMMLLKQKKNKKIFNSLHSQRVRPLSLDSTDSPH